MNETGGSGERGVHWKHIQAYLSNFTYSEDGLMVKRAGSGGWLWFPVLPDAGSVNSADGWMMDPPAANNHLAAGRLSLEN